MPAIALATAGSFLAIHPRSKDLEGFLAKSDKESYYVSLRRIQQSLKSAQIDFSPWLTFFLRSLMQQKRHLEQKLARTQSLALLQLPPLSAHILALITEHGRLTISELEKLTQANRNTLKKHLRNLVQSSQLIMVGKGKGTAYRPTGR